MRLSRRCPPPVALAVPLPRFTPRVGGGSATAGYFENMKTALLLLFVVAMTAGCQQYPQATATNRMASAVLFDEHYLNNVFIPSYGDASTRSALSNSVSQLKAHLIELRTFMIQVESGKIGVKKVEGGWESFVEKKDYWIYAGYVSEMGPVVDFQKHKNQDPFPLIYCFSLYSSGYLRSARTLVDGFEFDEQGQVKSYWHK